MNTENEKCGLADEARSMRFVRAATWAGILALAGFFWTGVVWLVLAYALP